MTTNGLRLIITAVLLTGSLSYAKIRINAVYGGDQRVDMFEVHDPVVLKLADSTVSIFDKKNLFADASGYSTKTTPMSSTMRICADEKFADQPTPADCSGVLISPTQVLTAGHCVSNKICQSTAFVFGYRMEVAGVIPSHFPSSNVYFCDHVASRANTDSLDFAIVELDREVKDHTPVPLAKEPIDVDEPIYLLSHPAGTPLKYSAPVPVLATTKNHFTSEIDALGGSSGGAVFSAQRNELVGILVSGADDYVEDTANGCRRINQCAPGRCEGEQSTHVNAALAN